MTGPVLRLEGFGVGFRERVVLADVTLEVARAGVFVVMGPAGGGKSTLLRTLAGLNRTQPELRAWGTARYDGRALGAGQRPALVQQDARYFVSTVRENLVSAFPDRERLARADQNRRVEELLEGAGATDLLASLDDEALTLPAPLRRLLGVLRAMATGAPLVCLDETTANLDDAGAGRVLAVMRWYARTRAVLFVTHHQDHARAVADRCALLAGGRVQEDAPVADFFGSPKAALTRHFLDTGSVSVPAPDAPPEHLAEGVAPPPPLPPAARVVAATNLGPRGFSWLVPGRLGGLPRPGIVSDLEGDLAGLKRLAVTTLVTLEETATVPAPALERFGLSLIHFPVVDMAAPGTVETAALCGRIARLLDEGDVIAFHCRAGQGRTGTLLACQLIWQRVSAVDALDRVRSINPKWVTSDAQVRFLEIFSDFVRWHGGHATGFSPRPSPIPERKIDVA